MDFYKKLKATKSTTNENITDNIIDEVDRKLEAMQPVIHASIVDKPKVQKTLLDIKTNVDSLNNLGVAVSVDRQERIQEITRKYREISAKYSDISASVPKSPRLFRRKSPEVKKEHVQAPQNKVALLEVEEKLKSMRQRRLDRLSVFVAEQSKLSEERSHTSNESNEIEDAIKSIQNTEADKKINSKIVEDNLRSKAIQEEPDDLRYSPKLGGTHRNNSNKNGSSEEDLTADVYEKAIKVSDKLQITEDKDLRNNLDLSHIENPANDLETILDNPLLSPMGKQRRAVYMYDHECEFLEKEKRSSLPPLSTFGKGVTLEHAVNSKSKVHTYENTDITVKYDRKSSLSESSITKFDKIEKASSDEFVRKKISYIYENLRKDLNENRTSTKSLRTDEHIDREANSTMNKLSETISIAPERNKSSKPNVMISKKEDTVKTGETKLPIHAITNKTLKLNVINSIPPPPSPLRSPLPIPRRSTHAERVLKKMQRNWENLNEILENDSDVDGDEIDDLRKTWEEADAFLKEYKARIMKLDKKIKEEVDIEKLKEVKCQLDDMEEVIRKFKGLKRDSSYKQLSNRLSSFYLDVSKMNFALDAGVRDKKNILDKIDRNIRQLEEKVVKNEALLMEILDIQVRSIGTNFLCITKV